MHQNVGTMPALSLYTLPVSSLTDAVVCIQLQTRLTASVHLSLSSLAPFACMHRCVWTVGGFNARSQNSAVCRHCLSSERGPGNKDGQTRGCEAAQLPVPAGTASKAAAHT